MALASLPLSSQWHLQLVQSLIPRATSSCILAFFQVSPSEWVSTLGFLSSVGAPSGWQCWTVGQSDRCTSVLQSTGTAAARTGICYFWSQTGSKQFHLGSCWRTRLFLSSVNELESFYLFKYLKCILGFSNWATKIVRFLVFHLQFSLYSIWCLSF